MRKQDKIFTVQNLAAKFKEAKTVILTDYQGLTAKQLSQLRTMVKKVGGEIIVVKNTLLKRALEDASLPIPENEGPTAIVISTEAEIEPIRAISQHQRNIGLPKFKSGIWGDRLITAEELEELGQLPSKDQLLVKLTSLLRSPSVRLISSLSGNQRKLALILKTRSTKSEILNNIK
jgi:large subunit ribosomal protein L10